MTTEQLFNPLIRDGELAKAEKARAATNGLDKASSYDPATTRTATIVKQLWLDLRPHSKSDLSCVEKITKKLNKEHLTRRKVTVNYIRNLAFYTLRLREDKVRKYKPRKVVTTTKPRRRVVTMQTTTTNISALRKAIELIDLINSHSPYIRRLVKENITEE